MKGVVLAGGTGSRLNPLRRVTSKHLLKPSGRSELEITDVSNFYIDDTSTYKVLDGRWTGAGTFDSLLRANDFVAETGANKIHSSQTARQAVAR